MEIKMSEFISTFFMSRMVQAAVHILCILTGWILNDDNLSGFTWITNPGFVLCSDLELNLRPFVNVCHLELSLFVWSLAALEPASSQFLFLLNHVPEKSKVILLSSLAIPFGTTINFTINRQSFID